MSVIRAAGPDDVEAVARLEADCLGEDAWSEGLVGEGIRGALPTVTYLVARAAHHGLTLDGATTFPGPPRNTDQTPLYPLVRFRRT